MGGRVWKNLDRMVRLEQREFGISMSPILMKLQSANQETEPEPKDAVAEESGGSVGG